MSGMSRVNRKHVRQLYTKAGLTPWRLPRDSQQEWVMDFIHDRTRNGGRLDPQSDVPGLDGGEQPCHGLVITGSLEYFGIGHSFGKQAAVSALRRNFVLSPVFGEIDAPFGKK